MSEKKDWPDALFVEPDRAPSAMRSNSSPHRSGGDTSPSGLDWGWAKDQLREGVSPDDLEIRLAQARPDKRDPADYAKRTVARAKESLAMESLAKESLAMESLAMEMER